MTRYSPAAAEAYSFPSRFRAELKLQTYIHSMQAKEDQGRRASILNLYELIG